MKVKFNKFERVAGLFVLIALGGFVFSLVTVAVKQGWFDPKVFYTTEFQNGEGVHAGTSVQIAGLKAGSVDEVELTSDNKIMVKFYVFAKFAPKVRADSVGNLIRPFIIGERVLDILPGSTEVAQLSAGAHLQSGESTDLMTMLSGRNMGKYLETFSQMLAQVHEIANAILNKDSGKSVVELFNSIAPLVHNLNSMSIEVVKLTHGLNKNDQMLALLGELSQTTKDLNTLLPQFTDNAPKLARDVSTLVDNLAELTTEFKVVIPAMAAIGPELPRVSKRAVEALDEAVILMKAMEKSFLVRSNVKEVREEESSRKPSAAEKQ